MTRPSGIPREFYEDAIRLRDMALDRARLAEDRLAELVQSVVALKRHDVNAIPSVGFDLDALNPEHGLGQHTILAIDEWAEGDMELRGKLVARAHVLTASAKMQDPGSTDEQIDRYVAHQIKEGDPG